MEAPSITVDITIQVQIAYLTGLRRNRLRSDDGIVSYQIKEDDPIPEGLSIGEWIYPSLDKQGRLTGVSWGS